MKLDDGCHYLAIPSRESDSSSSPVTRNTPQRQPTKVVIPAHLQTSCKSRAAAELLSPQERILARLRGCLQALSGLSEDELGLNLSFLELGFDSLLLSRACSAIDAEFGVPITLRQVAEELSSVSRLAEYIESALPDECENADYDKGPRSVSPEIAEAVVDVSLPMVDAQREVWLAAQLDEDVSRTYNEARVIRVQGPLQVDILHESLQVIVNRHDALRAAFAADGSGQTIAGQMQVNLSINSLEDSADDGEIEQQLEHLIRASTTELFDLAAGPLFRFSLYDLGEQGWAILLVMAPSDC